MSYSTIALIAASETLFPRLVACAATLGKPKPVEQWVEAHRWEIAASTGWSDAWDAALTGDPGPDIGSNPEVITDAMILAAIQPLDAPAEPPAE